MDTKEMDTQAHLTDVSELAERRDICPEPKSAADKILSDLKSSKSSATQRKVDHLHKLERKHSSGDLHSRLKTRKLLGVGETDDGDVHRSKLSQILGHSEQLYVKLPKGLRIWQLANALMFSIVGFWALFFPINLFSFAVTSETDPVVILPIRLYGAALLTLAIMFWSTLWSLDRDTIRWSLRGSVLYFTVQFIVWSLSWFSVSHPGVAIGVLDVLLSLQGACVFIGPLVLSLPALFFYPSIGTKHNW